MHIPGGFVWSTELPASPSLTVQAVDSAGISACDAEQPALMGGRLLGQEQCPGCGGRWECCLLPPELPGPVHHSAPLPAQGSLNACWRET